MKKYTGDALCLGLPDRHVSLVQNRSGLCLKFSTLIDANTQVELLLDEAKADQKKENNKEISTQQPNLSILTRLRLSQADEEDNIKIKKFKSDSTVMNEPKPLNDFSGANYICAKLVLEKLLENCRGDETQLVALVSSNIGVGIRNIVSQFKNSQNYRKTTIELATLIEIILTSHSLSVQDISKIILNFEIEELPLFAIWKLSILQIISFEKVLNKIKGTLMVSLLLEDAVHTIFSDPENFKDGCKILKSFISTLIIISYGIHHEDYSKLQECSNKLLTELPQKILDFIEKNLVNEISDSSQDPFINIYETMINVSNIEATSLEKYFTNQLITILTFKPEIPLSQVIKEQEKWRSTRMNKLISKLMFSIIVGIGHILAFNTLDSVVSSLEVNWSHILTFLSTLLLSHPESATKLRGVTECYLRKGCSQVEMEFLILGFLFARHASQEGRHIFPSYSQWFGASFGSENSSPANSKKSFSFLFQFLTTLVPFESPTCLRAHIHQSIYVPKGCQKILRDYQHLARAQLQYLTTKPDPGNIDDGDNDQAANTKTKVLEEIECAVKLFEKMRKVPSFVIEASIFKRPYFLNTFLPLLLKPRVLPSKPDSKLKLIEELFKLDKIPLKTYNLYLDECKETKYLSESDKNEVTEPNSKPLATLKDLLERLADCLLQDTSSSGNDLNNMILNSLSQISNHLEELTKLHDLKFINVSHLTICENDYDSNSLLFQVIEAILEFSRRIVKDSESKRNAENSRSSNYLLQFLSLIAVSPALQHTMLVTLFHHLKLFEKEFSEKNIGFYGHLLSELKKIEGMFHLATTSTQECKQPFKLVDLIVANLPKSSTKHCLLSCFILSAILDNMLPEERRSKDYQNIISIYSCLSSRLMAMETEWQLMDITLTSFKRSGNRVIFAKSKIPGCCKLFVEGETYMNHVKLGDWLSFELKAPWGDTPLATKIRHLQYWFNFLVCKTDGTPENFRRKFLFIFWSMLEVDMQAKNAAEMVILLQNLLPSENCCNLALIEEWKNWKKANFTQKEEEPVNVSYQTKLVEFMSLCRCLPSDKFFIKENFVLSSSLLRELVLDILGAEGTLYLNFCDTLYLFEALIQTVNMSSFPAAQIQQCFQPIKDSLIFHWKSLKFATTVSFESVLDRSVTLKYLNNFIFDQPLTWKFLSPNDFATFFLATICDDDDVDDDHNISKINFFDAVASSNNLLTFWKCVCFLGNNKLRCRESLSFPSGIGRLDSHDNFDEDIMIISDDEDERNKKVTPVKSFIENENIISACCRILERNEFTDPVKVLAAFKTECGQIPIAWKSTLVGLVFILLFMLKDLKLEMKNCEEVAFLFSLFLCSFNSLAKLIESNENASMEDHDLSYISQLNQKVLSYLNRLPKSVLVLIPLAVVNQCDDDIKSTIKRSKSS